MALGIGGSNEVFCDSCGAVWDEGKLEIYDLEAYGVSNCNPKRLCLCDKCLDELRLLLSENEEEEI